MAAVHSKENDELVRQLRRLADMVRSLPKEVDDTPEMQARYGRVLGQTRHCLLLLDSLEGGLQGRHRVQRIAEWKPIRDDLLHKEFAYEALSGAAPGSDT